MSSSVLIWNVADFQGWEFSLLIELYNNYNSMLIVKLLVNTMILN